MRKDPYNVLFLCTANSARSVLRISANVDADFSVNVDGVSS